MPKCKQMNEAYAAEQAQKNKCVDVFCFICQQKVRGKIAS